MKRITTEELVLTCFLRALLAKGGEGFKHSVSDTAEVLDRTRQSVNRALNTLEAKGMVEKTGDRRTGYLWNLTGIEDTWADDPVFVTAVASCLDYVSCKQEDNPHGVCAECEKEPPFAVYAHIRGSLRIYVCARCLVQLYVTKLPDRHLEKFEEQVLIAGSEREELIGNTMEALKRADMKEALEVRGEMRISSAGSIGAASAMMGMAGAFASAGMQARKFTSAMECLPGHGKCHKAPKGKKQARKRKQRSQRRNRRRK